jgi:hypothetical protein
VKDALLALSLSNGEIVCFNRRGARRASSFDFVQREALLL